MESSTKNSAARISGLRQARGYTQQELADLVGKSLRTVQNWESVDGTEPRGKDLRKLCEVLEVEVAEFVSGKSPMPEERNAPAPMVLRETHAGPEIFISFHSSDPKAAECIKYVADYLNARGADPDQVRWFLVELKNRFPIEEKRARVHVPGAPDSSSRQVSSVAETSMRGAGTAAGLPESSPTREAGAPTVHKHKPASGVDEE